MRLRVPKRRRSHHATPSPAGGAAVLMYHGVGEVGIDPWGLFVSPSNFEQHLQVLREVACPMRLTDLLDALEADAVPPRAVAVTMDDGYANILHEALPLLDSHSVPATLFALSEPLKGATEYWWDELAALVLSPGRLPPTLSLPALGHHDPIELGPAADYTTEQWIDDHHYRDEERPAGPRMALYRDLWRRLLHRREPVRQQCLHELAQWGGVTSRPRDSHRNLSLEELLRLDGGVVDIGGHTLTHPLLPEVPKRQRRTEIRANKAHLEELLDRPIELFSYPFGAHDDRSVDAVSSAGYRAAVTTRPEPLITGTDRLRIGRFDVKDWDADRFAAQLRAWHGDR